MTERGTGGTGGDTSWLLREPPLSSDRHDELDPARGVITGFLLSGVLWAAVWMFCRSVVG